MVRYQLNRLSRGKATSGAPIISGNRKLPSVFGIDGTRENHTRTRQKNKNSLLWVSEVTSQPFGVNNSSRTSVIAMPPMKKKIVIVIAYRIAMRLWSVVISHDFSVMPWLR